MKKYIPILFLAFLIGIICGANYTPGTILSGWDTLQPEFNLPLAFSRILTGVWRTDQGLGAVAGHSHMAELPRLVILWILSFVEPVHLIRYTCIFMSLLSGVLGMYVLLGANIFAFLGALVYLTNLGTVQHFIVPFEMFTVQYALLPWIFYTAINYLRTPTRKRLLWFCLTIILASPMAYAATLWYVFFTGFTIFLLVAGWKRYRRAIKLIIITLLFNLYWILPNAYFVLFHGKEVELSKVNQLFSPEAFAKTQEFGTLANLPLLKNFLFDWKLYDYSASSFTGVMDAWQAHLNNPAVAAIGYAVFLLAIAGIVHAVKQKRPVGIAYIAVFVFSAIPLLNGTGAINGAFVALGTISGVAREALRFPFTKFSILFMVSLSVLAAEGAKIITKKLNKKVAIVGFATATIGLLLYFAPAFSGYLIQPAMRISIPQEYFDMFDWFKTQPSDKRVAILPIHTFWNWTYYRWGYQGAGFLQFGIPQPILDRDYDRWSPANEQYEREMSYAVYSQNPQNIQSVLTKYNISWVLVDNSVFAPASNENQTLLWLLPQLLKRAGLTSVKTFGPNITIYAFPGAVPMITGYTNLPSTARLHPYFSLLDSNERVTQPIPGTVVAHYAGRHYRSTDTPETDHADAPELDHGKDYLLEITSKNESGFPLQLCVSNNLTSHCDLYVHLGTQKEFVTERFLLPRLNDYGFGYSLNFNNFTIRGATSVNEIERIRIVEIEPQTVAPAPKLPVAVPQAVERFLPILYRVRITSPTTTLALYESFERGWIAVHNGKIMTDHILIDNWANGWTGNFGTNDIIYIMFWPQILGWIL